MKANVIRFYNILPYVMTLWAMMTTFKYDIKVTSYIEVYFGKNTCFFGQQITFTFIYYIFHRNIVNVQQLLLTMNDLVLTGLWPKLIEIENFWSEFSFIEQKDNIFTPLVCQPVDSSWKKHMNKILNSYSSKYYSVKSSAL